PIDDDEPEGGSEPDDQPQEVVAPDAMWQTTRFVRVGNSYNKKIKVYVIYQTVDQSDNTIWAPADPDKMEAIEYELNPGEVCLLEDDGWQINASKVRIWAEAPDTKWEQFKKKDLVLVPEKDKDGVQGYASANTQTFNVAFR